MLTSAFDGGFLGQSRIEYSDLVAFNAAYLFTFKIHSSYLTRIKIYELRSQTRSYRNYFPWRQHLSSDAFHTDASSAPGQVIYIHFQCYCMYQARPSA